MRRYHKTENRKPKTENPLPSASAMTLTNDKHTNTQTHHRVQRLLERVDLAQHVADHVPSVVLASYHHSMLTNGLVVERLHFAVELTRVRVECVHLQMTMHVLAVHGAALQTCHGRRGIKFAKSIENREDRNLHASRTSQASIESDR